MMKKIVIRDPIYGDIVILNPLIQKIIRTREFLRLSHIGQTPSVSAIFPGATGSRFLHCIGAYHLAEKIFAHKSFQVHNFAAKTILKVKIACLVHDIGHGPLSHTFEEINYLPEVHFSHEKNAMYFLKDPQSQIYQLLKQSLTDRDIDDITAMISGRSKHPLSVLVSSQIDTDRMDYLMRDN